MSEPTIQCPHCHTEIKLTESLAAPLIAESRKQFEDEIRKKEQLFAAQEKEIKQREQTLLEERTRLNQQVAQQVEAQLGKEREQIAQQEAQKAQKASEAELNRKTQELAAFQILLQERDVKLEEAQKAQLDLMKKQRELDDEKRQLELSVEKRVQEEVAQNRLKMQGELQEQMSLKIQQKDLELDGLRKKIEELKQRSEQGSQQLQGEAQEVELVSLLTQKFPYDRIERIGKGEFGGDVLQTVLNMEGEVCGTILWESKRTKHWSVEWLTKLRGDQREARAEVAILVSQALPKEVQIFDLVDGIWVCDFSVIIPIAEMMRHSLLQLNAARVSSKGQQTKTELVYQYLTGTGFRQRVEAIVEAFSTMKKDLDKERQVIQRQWAKRDAQIEQVLSSTVGLYGDLQGIAGQSLQEIKGLELDALLLEGDKEQTLFK